MEVMYPRCAGLDVHHDTVVACARTVEGRHGQHEVRTFGTTTGDLLALADWLTARGCTHVAMESTGVFWKPVWHVLEGAFTLVLANALQIRSVPGRKSDVNDATWIADLLAHGLIRGSFVPPAPVQALRDLTRTRKQLVREVAQHTLRIQKVLEDANVKLSSVLTDVVGVSGRAILRAIIAGEDDPAQLRAQVRGRVRSTPDAQERALRGRVTAHHRFLLALHLGQIEALEQAIHQIEARLADALRPFHRAVERLLTIPGVSHTVAAVLIAETGGDMAPFATAAHVVSWAGLCPRLAESAGKRLSTRTRAGAPWLKTTLVQAAWAAVRTKHSYFRAQFVRLKSRRGPKKAIIAVAASLLTAAYHMLTHDVPFADLGGDYFDRRRKTQISRRLIRRLQDLGFVVEVRPAA